MSVFLNGSFVAPEQARISVDDRGFVFGDGVYEVIRVRDGRLFEGEAHFARLADGVAALALAPKGDPIAPLRGLPGIADELLARNELTRGEATIYIQITRGAAPRTHAFPAPPPPPTIYAAARVFTPPAELRARGAAAITRPDIRWARCDIKSVNLLPNVLAKQHAAEHGALEAIFVRDGALTDGASTSVFAVIDGELRTPPLTNYILPGITRRVVLELAASRGIPARERPIFADELSAAAELFITGTTTDVMPICTLDGAPVGEGTPGPVARQLQQALEARIAGAPAP
ncbi:MAG TPA: aminotransferase class IV [Gemmatimonadaceae bacterium]